ncbi:MAG: hypothetical protein HLUCCO03_06065 [Marinobacter sp. HL-58]|nr:MAG: hypothetical protein HLUCCO03_06065 [Marinobacter sp. HL-58]
MKNRSSEPSFKGSRQPGLTRPLNPRSALLPSWLSLFGVLFAISGCNAPDSQMSAKDNATANQQTAFRVRSDFAASLNADSGWAGKLNEDVTVKVDEPFRLRFEVDNPGKASDGQSFQLQSRRNGGEWRHVGAENFPQPEKVLELDFSEPAAPMAEIWRLDSGDAAVMTMAAQDDESFLQVRADDDPILSMGRYDTPWEPIEFAVDMRLPEGGDAGAGIVFGYVDSENYNQVYVDPDGSILVHRIVDGEESLVAKREARVVRGDWFELKIVMADDKAFTGDDEPTNADAEASLDKDQVVVEYERGEEALIFTADLGATIPSSTMGFHVPTGGTVQFEKFTIEGKPRTPRVSIMASETFQHGEPTTDLLPGSSQDFTGGAGISFADKTPAWSGQRGQSEWEWPLVIRRFADGAVTNNDGDTFEFRMVDADGQPLQGDNPTVTATVPEGHLGGTFVETPARIGPWQASNGDLYFAMEPSETYNLLMTVKSTDGGKSWTEVDGANRPATGDLEGFAATLSGDTIHMLHQTSDDVWHHAFRTSDHPTQPDSWAIQDERLASPEEPPTQVADIAVRSDGSIVGVYGGPEKIHFKVRSPDGRWGDETVIDEGIAPDLSGPMMVVGKDDVIHLAYTGNDGTAWYRRMLPDGGLTPRERLATGLGTDSEDIGSILPLVYMPQTDTVSIIYRLETGRLWERRVAGDGSLSEPVKVSDHKVVQNAVDADQTGADAIADGNTVHVLFIEEESRDLFHTRTDSEGNWQPATPQVDNINAQWVRGARLTSDGEGSTYGFVYDAGADGGSGMNRYGEIKLDDN